MVDALVHVLERAELKGAPRRFVLTRLIDELLVSGDLQGARERIEELTAEGPHAQADALRARLDLGGAHLAGGDLEGALQEFERLRNLGVGTVFEHRARLGTARVHLASGKPEEAYRSAKPLVPLLYGEVRLAYGLELDDGRALALLLVATLEELGCCGKALRTARDARTRFPVRQPRGHGHSPRQGMDELELAIERLEARVVNPRGDARPRRGHERETSTASRASSRDRTTPHDSAEVNGC